MREVDTDWMVRSRMSQIEQIFSESLELSSNYFRLNYQEIIFTEITCLLQSFASFCYSTEVVRAF